MAALNRVIVKNSFLDLVLCWLTAMAALALTALAHKRHSSLHSCFAFLARSPQDAGALSSETLVDQLHCGGRFKLSPIPSNVTIRLTVR